jgi:acetyl esterase/lipase
MSILGRPAVSAGVAKTLQRLTRLAAGRPRTAASRLAPFDRFPEIPGTMSELTIPTSIAPARAVVYTPTGQGPRPPVHVNFHGGGFIIALTDSDDPLCRYLAAQAGVAVINVDYAVAPQYRFPAPPRQVYEVVQWIAMHGAEHGWDGDRLTIGGQSAGGSLAAAVARQALQHGGPSIALQVLHYAPFDLATDAKDKHAAVAKPMLRPWMAEVFDGAYIPDRGLRTDPLASPAHPSDTADLTGIAPALIITAEFDLLRAEGARYAERLRGAGALVDHHVVANADHGYDGKDTDKARQTYALIARHVRQAVRPRTPEAP